jgi:TolB protein
MHRHAVATLCCALFLAEGALAAQNITEIQIAPPQVTLRVGERSGLLATAFDRLGNVIPTAQFRWTSGDTRVVRVDNNGTVTGVAPGVAIVEAIAGSRKGVAAVQVIGAAPVVAPAPTRAPPAPAPEPTAGQPSGSGPAVALRVEPAAVYLMPSEHTRVMVRGLREDGGPAAPVEVSWTSLVPGIASVDPSGVVVALTPGQGTIKVTGPDGLTATAPVVVQQADIAIQEPGPVVLSPGTPDTLHVVVPSQHGRLVDPLTLSWSSSAPAVAQVSLTGIVTPAAPGQATITVTGLLQTRTVDLVVHRPVSALVARPRSQDQISLPIAGSARFSAEALGADKTPVPEAPIRWSVSDSTRVSLEGAAATGTVTVIGKAEGRVELIARAPGPLAATWTINVVAGELKAEPARIGLVPGRRTRVRVDFADDSGGSLASPPVTWSIEDSAVATVDADGAVSAAGWGRTRAVALGPAGKTVAVPVFVLGEVVVASSRNGRFGLYAARREALTDLRRLTPDTLGAADPTFSADGSRLAVVSSRDGNPEIYLMDPDGSNAVRLTNHPAVDGAPAFMPDGRTVVFHSDRVGGRNQIFAASTDGQPPRQLTQDSTNMQPAVSPDGRTIAFVSARTRNYDVWLMAPDGTGQRRFTTTPQWNERHPQFLGDGSLAYLVERPEAGRTITQVMRADLATGAVTALSGADLQITDFAASTAGDLLALVVPTPGRGRDRAPVYRVVVVRVGATGTPVELPAPATEQTITPAFVP